MTSTPKKQHAPPAVDVQNAGLPGVSVVDVQSAAPPDVSVAERPISVGVLAVHERPELVDKLWQLITTLLHGLLQHVVYGFTIVHVLRPASGGRSHCFGARAAASATSRYNGSFLHMRCSRIKAKLSHPLLVSSAPVRTTRAKRANGRGTMTAGAVLGLRQILYETVWDY